MKNRTRISAIQHRISFGCFWFCLLKLYACQSAPADAIKPMAEVETAPEMIFELADAGALTQSVKVMATVIPYQQFTLQLPIGGRLMAPTLFEGQRVVKGSILLKLEPGELALDLEEAQWQLEQARMAYQLERDQRVSVGDTLTESQDRMLKIQFGLIETQLRYERALKRLKQTELRAPFSGMLSTTHHLSTGTWLNAGEAYGHLIYFDQVYLNMEVFANQLTDIHIGDPVRVKPLSQPCKVISTAASIQTETGTGRIVARCNNPDAQLLPGMQLEALIEFTEVRGQVRLPRRAVLQRDTAMVVFRLRRDRIEWVYVQPVAINEQWVVLSHGALHPGDTIAVDQHFTASHDAKVRPILQKRRE